MLTTKADQEVSDAFDKAADVAIAQKIIQSIFSKMDWKLLCHQKQVLLGLAGRSENGLITDEESDALSGILHLLDTIQDLAVDELGLSEDAVVFGGSNEEDPEVLDYLNNHGQGPDLEEV